MNLTTLKKKLPGALVGRAPGRARNRPISVAVAQLSYQVDPSRFSSEEDLAAHLRSKIPALNIAPSP